jgi:hypothetical protein
MSPADQRLKADNLARGELDLRLVIEHKLALVQGAAQVRPARPFWLLFARGVRAPQTCF